MCEEHVGCQFCLSLTPCKYSGVSYELTTGLFICGFACPFADGLCRGCAAFLPAHGFL